MELSTGQFMLIACVPFTLIALAVAVARIIAQKIKANQKRPPEDYD